MARRVTRMLCLVTISVTSLPALADPLQEAAYLASKACVAVGAYSLEHCGTEMGGSSPEKSAARRAVLVMLNHQAAFLRSCKDSSYFGACRDQADWSIGAGMARAEREMPTEPATLQSSTRR